MVRMRGKWFVQKNVRGIAAVGFLILLLLQFVVGSFQSVLDSDQETIRLNAAWITGQRDTRPGLFDQVEGTDEVIYFSYNMAGYIDAYDLSGQYLYTIHLLDDSQKGSIRIDCRDGLLYVESRHGALYIFDGLELLERMERNEAEARDLCLTRRHEKSEYLLTDTHVARVEGNEIVSLFLIPDEIAVNLTKDKWRLYIAVLMLCALLATVVHDRIRK
jgi:hypothetical protein